MRAEGLGHLKSYKDPTGNLTRDLPSCGAVPTNAFSSFGMFQTIPSITLTIFRNDFQKFQNSSEPPIQRFENTTNSSFSFTSQARVLRQTITLYLHLSGYNITTLHFRKDHMAKSIFDTSVNGSNISASV